MSWFSEITSLISAKKHRSDSLPPSYENGAQDWLASSLPADPGGRYRLLELVGWGGMGQVYKAYDSQLHRVVALKIMRRDDDNPQLDQRRFLREVKATARLDHPGIVALYDFGYRDGLPFFTMAFIEGVSLRQALRNRHLSIEETVEIMIRIAHAVAYAHRQGIIHRDLTPANIMLTAENQPRIMDFGLAKFSQQQASVTQSGTIMGTLPYMSPEQAEGYSHLVDFRTDIYALGVILYEMLTQRPPFQGNNPSQLLYQVVHRQPTFPADQIIPDWLQQVCLQAMAKDPQRRYASAEDFADDLGTASDKPRLMAVKAKSKFFNSRKAIIVAFAFLILIGSGIILTTMRQSPQKDNGSATRPMSRPTTLPTSCKRKIVWKIVGEFPAGEPISPHRLELDGRDLRDDNEFAPGSYRLEIHSPGYFPRQETITIESGSAPVVISKTLVTRPRPVKIEITHNIAPAARAAPADIHLRQDLATAKAIKTIAGRESHCKPGCYILSIRQPGYHPVQIKKYIWPGDGPEVIREQLIACKVRLHIPENARRYFFIDAHCMCAYAVESGMLIPPGHYYWQCSEGHGQLSPARLIKITPSAGIYHLDISTGDYRRLILCLLSKRDQSLLLPKSIKVDQLPMIENAYFRAGRKIEITAEFNKRDSWQKVIEIPSGSGAFVCRAELD